MPSDSIRLQETIKFGEDCELDLSVYELRRDGRALKLERIPMEVLIFLIERKGRLVTREEIAEKIWGKNVFLDTDNSINGAIRKIRQALKDDPERPYYLQTVTGRGYRFIAPVFSDDRSKKQGTLPEQPPEGIVAVQPAIGTEPGPSLTGNWPSDQRRGNTQVRAIFALLIFIAIGLVLWWVTAGLRSRAVRPIRSIAVLPLDNFSGDPSQDYFVDGMSDALITDLAKVSSLHVTSRTSAMRYKGTKKSLPEIARELNVDAIVEGSVTRAGGRVRVTAQLINASTDQHLWAETYERDLGEVLTLQSEVAHAIALQVQAQLTPQDQARLGSARLVNPEAYDAYLKGRYYLSNEFTKAQPLNMAKAYFEESIRKDPGFALAYAGLADSYVWLALFHQLAPDTAYKSAQEALRKAQELDGTIGEAHDTLGLVRWRFEWDWDAAEQEFNQAVTLNPNYSCAHEDHAVYLAFMGRRDEALTEVAKSREIDPGPSSAMAEAAAYYQLRDYGALIESSRRGIASNPTEWTQYANLGVGYEGTGKKLEAVAAYQKAVEMSNGDQDVTASLAHACATIGRRSEAQKILYDLQRQSKTKYISPYVIATIYAGLGDKDKAFAYLDQAFQQRSSDLSWYIKADLRMDNLRSDPRFNELLRRIHLN